MNDILFSAYPLLQLITNLPSTSVVWQGMPAVHDRTQRNNHILLAVNYMVKKLLEPLNIGYVPAMEISLVWSENLGSSETHLFNVQGEKSHVKALPPGTVVTYLMTYNVCQGYS